MLNSLIDKEFRKCLEKFPELKDVELIVEGCEELAGAEGRFGDKRVVILFIPEALRNKSQYLAPIIYHELSHIVDRKNPDKIFFERADEKSKQLWKLLQNAKILNCQIE